MAKYNKLYINGNPNQKGLIMKIATLDLIDSIYHDKEAVLELNLSKEQQFDSYHNSFFTSYWSQYTNLKEITLNLDISGSGLARLIKRAGSEHTTLTEKEIGSGKLTLTTSIPFDSSARVYLELTPKDGEEIIIKNNAYWSTNQEPEKNVKLAIIMCTFNKQSYVNKNLNLLLNHEDFKNSDIELFVVDNASNLNLTSNDKLHYFHQDNFGGAGGFTRGLIEARRMNKFTHYQFMDDDILLDPDMILRAKNFLSFTNKDFAFSGAMLCMDNKNRLWEAGAKYPHPSKNLTPAPCFYNTPLSPKLLDDISQPYDFDYGGWWFYTFSEEIVKEIGLPYPFFIRGDDVEYSLRIQKAGFKTINLPGVCVWHETFFGKTGYWLQYYNTRNYITFSLMYFSWRQSYKMGLNLIKMLLSDLLFFQYQKATIMNKAIFDIQTSLFHYHKKSTPQHQQKLLKSIAHIKDRNSEGALKETVIPGRTKDIILKLVTLNYHLVPTITNRTAIIDSHAWKPRFLKSKIPPMVNEIVISNRNNSQSFAFKKNPALFLKLVLVTAFNLTAFLCLLPVYKVAIPFLFKQYKTTNFWKSFLKIT